MADVDQSTEVRAREMLLIAAQYIRNHWPDATIHYDGADCDGYCVADDCESIADGLALKCQRGDYD